MKNKFLTIICCLIVAISFGQPPTGASSGIVPPSPPNSSLAWYRGGNTIAGTGGANNIFGTAFNSPIYTITNNQERTRLNGTQTATINLVPGINTSGYFGIAPGGYFAANTPATMLHLYGPNNVPGFGIGGGYRTWMGTGMLVNENSDAMYVGMKPEVGTGTGTNRSDAIICWNDDGVGGQTDIDKLRFIFSGAYTNGNGNGLNPLDPRSLNGYEYMRMSSSPTQNNSTGFPVGNIGIGPVFTNAAPPQNRLHMNSEEYWSNWFQMSIAQSTGQTNTDGLKLGILGDAAPASNPQNGNAFLYNQENRYLLFSTNHATPSTVNATAERMRITAFGTPTNLPAGGYGLYTPPGSTGAVTSDFTRMSISEDPAFPVTRPLSLLHLGYNTGLTPFIPPGSTDGWRPWMDIGMFISNGTDNGYLGLKTETGGLAGDRQDMVLNWGDNQTAGPLGTGPDNMRFIFTATTTGVTGFPPATGADGLEGMRMTPTAATGIYTGIGGDPSANLYSGASINPTATLEVNSWGATSVAGGSSGLRFTNLQAGVSPTTPNPGPGVLSVNASGDVIYVPGGSGSGGPGNYCSAPSSALASDYEMPLNDNNYYFTGQTSLLTKNAVGVGYSCGTVMPAKFNTLQLAPVSVGASTMAGSFLNQDVANTNALSFIGVKGEASGIQTIPKNLNIGGYFTASNCSDVRGIKAELFSSPANTTGAMGAEVNVSTTAARNYGVFVNVFGGAPNLNMGVSSTVQGAKNNIGGFFEGVGTNTTGSNVGIQAHATSSTLRNIAGSFVTDVPLTGATGAYIAVSAFAGNSHSTALPADYAIAVYGNADNPNNGLPGYAGYFDGDVYINGTGTGSSGIFYASDQLFKTNIDSIPNALALIRQFKPRNYFLDTANGYGIKFPSEKQYGLIAQDVELVLPELVGEITKPAMTDSAGNVVTPGVTYKTLNYNAFIAILMKGMQEQQSRFDSLKQNNDSVNGSLQDQINVLSDMINACCSSHQAQVKPGNVAAGLDVELKDGQSIVLEQNVPNPFAEQTTISYYLPENISKAQILFYNAQGKLIQSTELTQKGKGQLNVFASDLSNGIYTYTLVVDGKIIETKKMMKQ
ncbi:MAG: Collagen triple helix repeat-containing protein [Bacteroidetes bacterium]|nr:Collagen triple helix repeat-containing protein [Bacteroidota bacterium]